MFQVEPMEMSWWFVAINMLSVNIFLLNCKVEKVIGVKAPGVLIALLLSNLRLQSLG